MGRPKDPFLNEFPYKRPRFLTRESDGGLGQVCFLDGIVRIHPNVGGLSELQRRCLIRASLGQSNTTIAEKFTALGVHTTLSEVKDEMDAVEKALHVKERHAYFPAAVALGVLSIAEDEYGDPEKFPANLSELEVLQLAARDIARDEIGKNLDPIISTAAVEARMARLRNNTFITGLAISVTCAEIVGYFNPQTLEINQALAA
ncbi:MAG TPA: hypothetical protein VLG47_04430 [Candidatus Saccharimonadales bacterium]|nr:hypothetical protein [Candidatus Saccharimonadales bacterium]